MMKGENMAYSLWDLNTQTPLHTVSDALAIEPSRHAFSKLYSLTMWVLKRSWMRLDKSEIMGKNFKNTQ